MEENYNNKTKKRRKTTPRFNYEKSQKLGANEVIIADATQERVINNLEKLLSEKRLRNIDLVDELSPIIMCDSQISKLLHGTSRFSLEVIVALHYAFDLDLNEFLAGDTNFYTKRSEKDKECLQKIDEAIQAWKA